MAEEVSLFNIAGAGGLFNENFELLESSGEMVGRRDRHGPGFRNPDNFKREPGPKPGFQNSKPGPSPGRVGSRNPEKARPVADPWSVVARLVEGMSDRWIEAKSVTSSNILLSQFRISKKR